MHISNEKVLNNVKVYFNRNSDRLDLTSLNEEDSDHLIRCGAAVIETYLGINKYQHGSFAKAVAENNLRDAFNFADRVNRQHMQFHACLLPLAWELANKTL